MRLHKKRIALFLLLAAAVLLAAGCGAQPGGGQIAAVPPAAVWQSADVQPLDEAGTYTAKDDVALYLHLYGRLPGNFITKAQAQALGWDGGGLEEYAPGQCIGGDGFGNYEGLLPAAAGRTYRECDIGTLGQSGRGAARLVYSNDGLIYYTGNHYESFTLLYGAQAP